MRSGKRVNPYEKHLNLRYEQESCDALLLPLTLRRSLTGDHAFKNSSSTQQRPIV